jgi:hypothetical protein
MKTWMWVAIAIAAAGGLLLVASPQAGPMVTVQAPGVVVKVTAPAEVIVGNSSTNVDIVSTVAPSSGTTVPNSGTKFKLQIPEWLGSPLARGALYSLASVAAVFLLQWLKKRYVWDGKKMVEAAIVVVAAFGAILTYLFQDKGASLLSNVWVLGGSGGFLYMAANLIYKWKFKKW